VERRLLGRTGLWVSSLCLGAFGGWGNEDPRQSRRTIDQALEAGINLIDTADSYGEGLSEAIVGEALAGGRRDRVIVATKFSRPMGPGVNERGLSRRWIARAVEASLRRLRTDWIDLYQIHHLAPNTDLDGVVAALSDLVHAGKVRYFGTATFPAHRLVELQRLGEQRGRERSACEQSPYSLLARGAERDVFRVCQEHAIGVLTWSPLAGGWLSGRYRRGVAPPRSTRAAILPDSYDPDLPANRRKLEVADDMAALAERAGLTPIQLALGFVLTHPAVSGVIIGPRTVDHLETYLAAAETRLGDDVLDEIDQIVPPGTNVNPADPGWDPPEITDSSLRRRAD
jgi:aryl-alcohol dehydrogenase-like predicted oxidoreductase